MSYSIEMAGPPGSHAEAFRSYFTGREHYELEGGDAVYENPHTGVHFVFAWIEPEDWEEDRAAAELEGESPPPATWAEFILNLLRPPGFLEEACLELRAFLARFGDAIHDPQVDTEVRTFDEEAFRASWSESNRWGIQGTVRDREGVEVPHRPEAELLAHWRWNHAQPELTEALDERAFVPHIGTYRRGKRMFSATVWTDGMPIALPRTDLVVIYREELAPRRLFRRTPSVALVAWEEARLLSEGRPQDDGPLPYLLVEHDPRPDRLTRWIRELPPLPESPPVEAIPYAHLLASEFLERAT